MFCHGGHVHKPAMVELSREKSSTDSHEMMDQASIAASQHALERIQIA
jgi:hypothetical protein